MPFTIKDQSRSLCFSCYHAERYRPFGATEATVRCGIVKKIVAPMQECSEWLPHCRARAPYEMTQVAWSVDVKPKGKKRIGFDTDNDVEILSPIERRSKGSHKDDDVFG